MCPCEEPGSEAIIGNLLMKIKWKREIATACFAGLAVTQKIRRNYKNETHYTNRHRDGYTAYSSLQPCSTACNRIACDVSLKMAVLPIIDTLPLYVAQQQGYFEKHGLAVELVPVASAPERVQLMAAGQVDGTINETLAVMQFNKEGVQVQAVRYALRPVAGYGHFFILASGQSGITTPESLKNVEIGVSQGTVIEYVTERLLQNEGLSSDEIKTIPVPKIPDRMSLLASGELSAGTLPDPFGA